MKILAFINKGTDCYINATLQILFTEYDFINYLYNFRDDIMEFDTTELVGQTDEFKSIIGVRLLQSLVAILYKVYDPECDTSIYHRSEDIYPYYDNIRRVNKVVLNLDDNQKIIKVYMDDLREIVIGSFGDNYTKYSGQKDAHEFQKKLLEFLNQGLIAMGIMIKEENKFTIINRLFWGSTYSCIESTECNHNSVVNTQSDYFDLTIPINLESYKEAKNQLPEGTDVQTYINEYFEAEELDEKNKWYCEECNEKKIAIKFMTMNKTPEILTVCLARFQFDHVGSKIRKSVTINPIISIKTDKEEVEYALTSCIIHQGNNLQSGHYIALVKHFDNSWYLCNDTIISKEKNINIRMGHENKDAYILFYRKIKHRY